MSAHCAPLVRSAVLTCCTVRLAFAGTVTSSAVPPPQGRIAAMDALRMGSTERLRELTKADQDWGTASGPDKLL